ncbi:MAG TPA: sulfite exporter TauE/SafE family protein [Planctomycetota bacterium]|nr:sulfite exporter TauE/SafE family protein [Planctomycetota bacterium]
MTHDQVPILAAGVLVVAFLYSSVGHAGASGYIAVMSLAGLAPAEIRPAALVLNILVASLSTYQFWRAGHFSWRLFWPFAVLSVPLAFVGGAVSLPTRAFKMLVGAVLLFSAWRLVIETRSDGETHAPRRPVALLTGGGLGLLSGLTGTGGGIFLTPLLLLMHWARTKNAAAVSALFILLNSIAGLAGNLSATRSLPGLVWPLLGAAFAGGAAGSYLGSRRLSHTAIKRLLAVVLVIAGAKLIAAP